MREFEHKKASNGSPSPFFGPKVQKKLTTGTVGDRYEKEADNVADKVVNKPKTGGLLSTKREETVQQKPLSETISKVQKQDLAQEKSLPKRDKEEDKKVQKKSDKEEDKKVQKKAEKEEDKKVQKKSDKEEDKKVQKKAEKEEDKKVQKKSDKEEDKKVQKKAEKEEDKKVQKKCADCEGEDKQVQKKEDKEEEKTVQAKLNESNSVNEGVESDLNSSKGSGNGMDATTKQEMEAGFGADFSNVNIHTDSKAVQMSEQLGAQAFTHGNDVYFNKGKYNPDSKEGKHLLAHELTHTIQQTGTKTANNVQKKNMLQFSTIPWNISRWTTQIRESNNFSVSSGGTVTVTSNLEWTGPPRCSNIASTMEVKIYRKRFLIDSNEHSAAIPLSGGSTSVSNLTDGTYYVQIILSGYNGDPTHCSLTGSLSIDAS
ncbi:eCIS core domain-containing protein [Flavobacterium hungaricum]|uniref:eCIS core domain-containing protein n=1 Tax=Flavobacterium hungaricum TaxID=2082725 RepID=UPI001D13B832|nr:DUF4157 domain-containing protein [Flavobacterium hungaricum]